MSGRARLNPAGVRCFIPGALSTACGDQDIFEYGQLVVSASISSRDAVTSVDGDATSGDGAVNSNDVLL